MRKEIPLFPLNTVLFPGMPLQLHIFEERYKRMVNYCNDQDSLFGVVLIKQGQEALGPLAEPYQIGCAAKITSLEPLSQGRFNIWAIGQERFEIVNLKRDLPYLVGIVEEYPLRIVDQDNVIGQMQSLLPLFKRYLRALGQGDEIDKVLRNIPSDPQVFSFLCAVLLQIPSPQKQSFLEAPTCLELMEKLDGSFRKEVAFVESQVVTHPTKMQGSFSIN